MAVSDATHVWNGMRFTDLFGSHFGRFFPMALVIRTRDIRGKVIEVVQKAFRVYMMFE